MKSFRFKFRETSFLLAVIAGLSFAGMAPASDQPISIDSSGAEITDLWFVELQSQPLAAGGRKQQVQRDKANFRSAAAQAGIQFKERYAFDTLWNGFSIQVDPGQVATLTLLPGVKGVYPVTIIEAPQPDDGSRAELATALAMTGADVAQDTLGLSGAGIRVAVIDSGINYDHPDLGGCFGPGCRVETGFDFVGEFFNGFNDPVPDDDPNDCVTPNPPNPLNQPFAGGHGTHVAGIVGADAASADGVTGVAPGVTFGAYRVFGCVGSTSSDIIIAAMERALADNMHVLNMSIGSSFQWPQFPTAVASDNLVNAGMVVVASIGNAGATGVYSASAPGVGKKVIGVASVDNTAFQFPFFEVDGEQIAYIPMSGSPAPPTSGTEEIVFIGQACVDTEGDTLEADPDGKVALAVRGVCPFREKAEAAIAAGATAVVIHNNAPGLFSGTVGAPPLDTPVVGISQADGLFIRSLDPPVELTWQDGLGSFPNPSGGLISSFSSYGLAPDLSLKPDISAPGGAIRSTFPLALGTYATLSGTSMASPHVAGSAALLLEARPNTSSQAAGGILQNSADPFVWWGNPGLGFLDNVHRQGAGLVDIPGAVQATTKIEPAKLSLGESEAGPVTSTLSIENDGSADVTYGLSFVNALTTGGSTFAPGFFLGNASVAFSENPVTVPAGTTGSVDATITPATGPNLGQYGGYIVFSGDDGSTFRVPYAGFVGDYQAIQVLAPIFGGLIPGLGVQVAPGSFGVITFPGFVFTMEDEFSIPFFLVHLRHQSRRLRMEVFDADTGKSFQRAAEFQFVGRNSTETDFFVIGWNGVTFRGVNPQVVPDGNYVLVLSILKALGDEDNPDHFESVTSVPFTIERP